MQMCVKLCVFVLYDASQAPGAHWDLPHWVGSAPLTSLSSLDKDGRNLPLAFSLPPHLLFLSSLFPPSVLLLHHLSLSPLLLPFCLPESRSIFVLVAFLQFVMVSPPTLSLSLLHFLPLSCIVSLSSACGLISLVCCCWCCWLTEAACHAWFGGLG